MAAGVILDLNVGVDADFWAPDWAGGYAAALKGVL
jgi:hypothetical protein